MMDYDKINWREELKKAPEKIQEAIMSARSSEIFEEIVKKHKLHVDQAGVLAREIDMVMFGLSPANKFISRIEENLNIDSQIAQELTKSVNERVFSVVREHLKEGTLKKVDVVERQTSTNNEINLNREQILREIEDDGQGEESNHSNSTDNSSPKTEGVGGKEFLSENVENGLKNKGVERKESGERMAEESTLGGSGLEIEKLPTKQNIFEKKLQEPVNIPSQEREIKEQEELPAKAERETYKGGVDPYREQLE